MKGRAVVAEEDFDKASAVLEGKIADSEVAVLDDDELPIPEELIFNTPEPTEEELAAKEKEDPDAVVEFQVDGTILVAYRPDSGAWTLILAALSKAANISDRTNAIMNFVYASLDEASQQYVTSRLMDRDDRFDIEVLAKVMNGLIKKWAPAQSRAQRRSAARSRGRGRR
jgi:hypothetical protein